MESSAKQSPLQRVVLATQTAMPATVKRTYDGGVALIHEFGTQQD